MISAYSPSASHSMVFFGGCETHQNKREGRISTDSLYAQDLEYLRDNQCCVVNTLEFAVKQFYYTRILQYENNWLQAIKAIERPSEYKH